MQPRAHDSQAQSQRSLKSPASWPQLPGKTNKQKKNKKHSTPEV